MGALDSFLKRLNEKLDPYDLFDPEVEVIDSTSYAAPTIYKYFSPAGRSFFVTPRLRFSQREALNDPWEMSSRWKQIGTDGIRKYFSVRLHAVITEIYSNPDYQIERFQEISKEQGAPVPAEQLPVVAQIFRSDQARSFMANLLPMQLQNTQAIVNLVFDQVEANFDRMLEDVISKAGVLSLTEDPLNELMWARYAAAWTGFVVGFRADHGFFRNSEQAQSRHLLKRSSTRTSPLIIFGEIHTIFSS